MSEELKDSGIVTALSVAGLVFGIICLLGAFIPCIGAVAFYYVGIPAIIISGIALGVAYSQKAKMNLAIAALTVSIIGAGISFMQYSSIISGGDRASKGQSPCFIGTTFSETKKGDF